MERPPAPACLEASHFWQRVLMYQRTGSRVICDPPPEKTDDDWIVLVGGDLPGEMVGEDDDGLDYGGSEWPEDQFASLRHRHGDTNLIITNDRAYYMKFVAATQVCRKLNLLDKNDRVMVFRAILYGNLPDGIDDYSVFMETQGDSASDYVVSPAFVPRAESA